MLLRHPPGDGDALREDMRLRYRASETAVLDSLLPHATFSAACRSRAWARARALVEAVRATRHQQSGIDALLQEYALSTEEGVVLMCLAEALLRVPDPHTTDRLIRDKLAAGDWSAHLGNSDSLFVNASAWGLLLSGHLVDYNDADNPRRLGLLKRTLGRLGEPVIRAAVRQAMQIMGEQFVMGDSIDAALSRARASEARGYRYSYDMLGEAARTGADAERYFRSYRSAIAAIAAVSAGRGPIDSPGISVKLSALHPRYEEAQRERVMVELLPRLRELALAAAEADIGLTIDAEEAGRLELSLDLISALCHDPALGDWQGLGLAVQAYQKRALWLVDWIVALADHSGRRLMVRLVKGAYWDSEIKQAQVEGLADYPVFTRKAATDISYQACAARLLAARDRVYPQFATHNAYTVATLLELDESREGYEFQRLHGMGESLYAAVLADEPVACRIYAPVGVHADLLAYLVRRLLENGANTSFVNHIYDDNVPVERLLEDPVDLARDWQQARHPQIPLPPALYGSARANARGLDLTDPLEQRRLRPALMAADAALPLHYPGPGRACVARDPATGEVIGQFSLADAAAAEAALARATAALPTWSAEPARERAACLRRLATRLEDAAPSLMTLCCREAGKTLPDALAEVREAVDFLRYYALQAEALEGEKPRGEALGVVLCISPWNFPLAIFLGQLSAAVATGNTVIAKPAEQTSLLALRTGELLRASGFPEGVINILPGEGRAIGEQLLPDPRIRGVLFTGSTATAHRINRCLAARPDAPVPLIAETGGQNCMIVDSTALPEQVVRDVLASGFQSAGQRCSALRVLYLQEDVADRIIHMLVGAMRELRLDSPAWLSSDLGPVIDRAAHERLWEHVHYLDATARLLYACEADPSAGPLGFPPRLYEIPRLSLLQGEVFGPIVHVIRYRAENLDAVLADINNSGFGLTFGMHSRIERSCQRAAARVAAGNIYVNRNMIGAVVGVQPFGGRGLSGTGPKAGGPNYLRRLRRAPAPTAVAGSAALPAGGERERLFEAVSRSAAATWSRRLLEERLLCLRRLVAILAGQSPSLTGVAEAAGPGPLDLQGDRSLERILRLLRRAREQLSAPLTLPGPTGESNTLRYEPRGLLLLVADTPDPEGEALLALVSCLAGGNSVLLAADDAQRARWQQRLDAASEAGLLVAAAQLLPLAALGDSLLLPELAGVWIAADSPRRAAVASRLAERQQGGVAEAGAGGPGHPGPLLPLFCGLLAEDLLTLSLHEKAVSTDTTAAGGNASLMTLTES